MSRHVWNFEKLDCVGDFCISVTSHAEGVSCLSTKQTGAEVATELCTRVWHSGKN